MARSVLLLGQNGVGKTTLAMGYTRESFRFGETPRSVFDRYSVTVPESGITVEIVDISDTESFFQAQQQQGHQQPTGSGEGVEVELAALNKSIPEREIGTSIEAAFLECDVVLLVFSMVDPGSLDSIRHIYLPVVTRYKPLSSVILVGTKSDLVEDRATMEDLVRRGLDPISRTEAESLAKALGLKFFMTSSKTREGVREVFDSVILCEIRQRKLSDQLRQCTEQIRCFFREAFVSLQQCAACAQTRN